MVELWLEADAMLVFVWCGFRTGAASSTADAVPLPRRRGKLGDVAELWVSGECGVGVCLVRISYGVRPHPPLTRSPFPACGEGLGVAELWLEADAVLVFVWCGFRMECGLIHR